jgi:hypothetical protein
MCLPLLDFEEEKNYYQIDKKKKKEGKRTVIKFLIKKGE